MQVHGKSLQIYAALPHLVWMSWPVVGDLHRWSIATCGKPRKREIYTMNTVISQWKYRNYE